MGEIGRSAENVFYSFVDFISDTLGFRVTKETTKQKVGEYFTALGTKLGEASVELEKVAEKAATDGDKDGLLNKTVKEAVDAAKATLSALKGHVESLGTVGDSKPLGDAATSQTQGVSANDGELKKAYKALKGIVDIAEGAGVAKLKAGNKEVKVGSADNKNGVKILAITSGNPDADSASKAALILASVSGEEILESIVSSKESNAIKLSGNASGTTTSLEFAMGGTATELSTNTTPKAAAVSGGIALRSLVKDGKLASGGNSDAQGGEKEVQGVGITATNKLLGAVEDLIKKAVKNILGTARQKIDSARVSKTTV